MTHDDGKETKTNHDQNRKQQHQPSAQKLVQNQKNTPTEAQKIEPHSSNAETSQSPTSSDTSDKTGREQSQQIMTMTTAANEASELEIPATIQASPTPFKASQNEPNKQLELDGSDREHLSPSRVFVGAAAAAAVESPQQADNKQTSAQAQQQNQQNPQTHAKPNSRASAKRQSQPPNATDSLHHQNHHHHQQQQQSSSSNSNSNSSSSATVPVSADYLAQLIKDKKQLAAFPSVFIHVQRLIDAEISKVRQSLFQLNDVVNLHQPLELPEQEGEVIQLQEKIYVPVDAHPEYNFVGRLLGPRGMTAKQLEQETGCKIMIRGRGSMRDKKKEEQNRGKANWEHLNDELHVLVTVEDTENRAQIKMNRALEEVKQLLIPVADGEDELKKRQLMELAIINGTYRDCNYNETLTKMLNEAVFHQKIDEPAACSHPQSMHSIMVNGVTASGPSGCAGQAQQAAARNYHAHHHTQPHHQYVNGSSMSSGIASTGSNTPNSVHSNHHNHMHPHSHPHPQAQAQAQAQAAVAAVAAAAAVAARPHAHASGSAASSAVAVAAAAAAAATHHHHHAHSSPILAPPPPPPPRAALSGPPAHPANHIAATAAALMAAQHHQDPASAMMYAQQYHDFHHYAALAAAAHHHHSHPHTHPHPHPHSHPHHPHPLSLPPGGPADHYQTAAVVAQALSAHHYQQRADAISAAEYHHHHQQQQQQQQQQQRQFHANLEYPSESSIQQQQQAMDTTSLTGSKPDDDNSNGNEHDPTNSIAAVSMTPAAYHFSEPTTINANDGEQPEAVAQSASIELMS